MAIIFWGSRKIPIGTDEFFMRCPSCEGDTYHDVLIISTYFHIYLIPIIPYEKEANLVCQQCGLRRNELPFDSSFFNNYYEVKGKFRHPWFSYAFVTSILILIALAIIFNV